MNKFGFESCGLRIRVTSQFILWWLGEGNILTKSPTTNLSLNLGNFNLIYRESSLKKKKVMNQPTLSS